MMRDHPRYFEILSIIDYYNWSLTHALKSLTMPDKRSGLDRMIDKATGYNKVKKEEEMKKLKGIIVTLKSKAMFEKIIDHENLAATLKILEKVRWYRGELIKCNKTNITKLL